MLVLIRIRLTSPFLGDLRPGRDGIRRFQRSGKMLKVDERMWREQFKTAAHNLKILVNEESITPPATLIPASIHLYIRRYSQVETDMFESFRKGTVLSTSLLINEHVKYPTLEQFREMLVFVGNWLGLSPWGNKFNYGRFEVMEVQEKDSNYGSEYEGADSSDGRQKEPQDRTVAGSSDAT